MTDDLKNNFAEPFIEMAARIEKNDPKEFAGAILIVPPSGTPIAVMMTDPSQDLDAFWSIAVSRAQIAQAEQMASRQQTGGNWPRR